MSKIVLYSVLLVAGIFLSQQLTVFAPETEIFLRHAVLVASMICLAFIMIRVGYEFHIDKENPRQYLKDYWVAATAAAFPWLFCALYFIFVLSPEKPAGDWQAIKEASLLSRFAAPTSAGILFSMLIAAGLAKTWTYRKARVLAIFDDLDTVLLMIPLKIMMVGLKWQLGIHVLIMGAMLFLAWKKLDSFRLPTGWRATLTYAVAITFVGELINLLSMWIDDTVPIHIEVLLPAFVLGVLIIPPRKEKASDEKAMTVIVSAFMVLVGLNLPALDSVGIQPGTEISILLHVLIVTFLINLGKIFPLFCYKNEARWQERLAVCVGMFPRGEVGAGILMLSLSYGIKGPMLAVAVFSLVLNLALSGVFILWVKALLATVQNPSRRDAGRK